MKQMKTMLTVRQAASLEGFPLTEFRLRELIRAGRCPGFYVGKKFLVDVEALLEMVEKACAGEVEM